MSPVLLALCLLLFIVAQAASALLFKLTSGASGLAWWLYFIAGNAVGFGCPVGLTLALKGNNPNLVYAIAFGGGFCLIQFSAWWFFREPLSPWQWSGIVFILCGIFFLQIR